MNLRETGWWIHGSSLYYLCNFYVNLKVFRSLLKITHKESMHRHERKYTYESDLSFDQRYLKCFETKKLHYCSPVSFVNNEIYIIYNTLICSYLMYYVFNFSYLHFSLTQSGLKISRLNEQSVHCTWCGTRMPSQHYFPSHGRHISSFKK